MTDDYVVTASLHCHSTQTPQQSSNSGWSGSRKGLHVFHFKLKFGFFLGAATVNLMVISCLSLSALMQGANNNNRTGFFPNWAHPSDMRFDPPSGSGESESESLLRSRGTAKLQAYRVQALAWLSKQQQPKG